VSWILGLLPSILFFSYIPFVVPNYITCLVGPEALASCVTTDPELAGAVWMLYGIVAGVVFTGITSSWIARFFTSSTPKHMGTLIASIFALGAVLFLLPSVFFLLSAIVWR